MVTSARRSCGSPRRSNHVINSHHISRLACVYPSRYAASTFVVHETSRPHHYPSFVHLENENTNEVYVKHKSIAPKSSTAEKPTSAKTVNRHPPSTLFANSLERHSAHHTSHTHNLSTEQVLHAHTPSTAPTTTVGIQHHQRLSSFLVLTISLRFQRR